MVIATGAVVGLSVLGGLSGTAVIALLAYLGFRPRDEQTPEAIPLPQRADQPEPEPSEALAAEEAEDVPAATPEIRHRHVAQRGELFQAQLDEDDDFFRERSSSLSSVSSVSDADEVASVASEGFEDTDQEVIAEKLKRRIDRLYFSKKIQLEVNHEKRVFRIETYRVYETENQALIKTCRQLFHPVEVLVNPHPDQERQSHIIDLPWSVLAYRHVQKIRRTYAKILHPNNQEARDTLLEKSNGAVGMHCR